MKVDYTIFYKESFREKDYLKKLDEYDLLISAYNEGERVNSVFGVFPAREKHWLLFPEYEITCDPSNDSAPNNLIKSYNFASNNEVDFFKQYKTQVNFFSYHKICIDITGFPTHYLIYFLLFLKKNGIERVSIIYTEPQKYIDKEDTVFSKKFNAVKTIPGCSSLIADTQDSSKRLLIMAPGYESGLIAEVAKHQKNYSKKILLLGFPSIQPDMYQENRLRIYHSNEALGEHSFCYAPANDPFVTAQELHNLVEKYREYHIYLAPISSKAQALGFALYFLYEGQDCSTQIIYPYCEKYSYETSSGISAHWLYTIELINPFS